MSGAPSEVPDVDVRDPGTAIPRTGARNGRPRRDDGRGNEREATR